MIVAALTVAEIREDTRAQYIFKPLAALGFLGIAVVAGAFESRYGLSIFAALLACAVGDLCLLSRKSERLLLLGIVAFAVGHALYIAAFLPLAPGLGEPIAGGSSLYPLAILAAILAFTVSLTLTRSVAGTLRVPAMMYAAIISLMLGAAILTRHPTIIIGALLFASSDYIVGRDRFITQAQWHPVIITPFYFGAQALFALSVLQL